MDVLGEFDGSERVELLDGEGEACDVGIDICCCNGRRVGPEVVDGEPFEELDRSGTSSAWALEVGRGK